MPITLPRPAGYGACMFFAGPAKRYQICDHEFSITELGAPSRQLDPSARYALMMHGQFEIFASFKLAMVHAHRLLGDGPHRRLDAAPDLAARSAAGD